MNAHAAGYGTGESAAVTSPPFSEDSLALLFTERHERDLRFTATLNKYHRLLQTANGGSVWLPDSQLKTLSEIRNLIREESGRIESAQKLNKLCSAATVYAVEKLAKSDQRTAMRVEQWDSSTMLLNTPCGLIDLENGKRMPGDPLAFCTKQTSVGTSTTRPELWLKCLATWTAGDEGLQQYLKRMAGYCLTGETREHQFFFLHGSGRNGKSVFLNTLSGILNTYAKIAPPEVFTAPKSGEKHPTGIASLIGCRMALATETEANSRWAESQLKGMVAGDEIAARYMRCDYIQFKPRFKLVVSGNHKPQLGSVDEAIRARLNLLPFEVIIPESERDAKLPAKLRQEWPAILAWMVQGCLEWQRDGLNPPACVKDATDNYMQDQDIMGAWIAERCILGPNNRAKAASLYGDWKNWCEASEQYKTSQKFFLSSLQERPNIRIQHTNSGNYVLGVGLQQDSGYEL